MISVMILLELVFALGVFILPIVWLVLLLAKANRKHIGKAVLICVICFIINGIAIGEMGESKEVIVEEETQVPVVVEQAIPEQKPIEVEEPIKEAAPEPGSSRSNPLVVTVSQFAKEINSNTDAAKMKYNGKWVRVTGKVLSAHNVAGMTNFYLYGKKGDSGLKIVCWINEEVLKPFDYRGETHAFIGQVREVSTVNSTEISDCEIIFK